MLQDNPQFIISLKLVFNLYILSGCLLDSPIEIQTECPVNLFEKGLPRSHVHPILRPVLVQRLGPIMVGILQRALKLVIIEHFIQLCRSPLVDCHGSLLYLLYRSWAPIGYLIVLVYLRKA